MTDDSPVFGEEATHISGRRFLAHAIDGVMVVVIAIGIAVPALIIESAAGEGTAGSVATALSTALLVAAGRWLFLGHLAWYVRQEGKDGFTLGKRATGIRVATADGGIPSRGALWKRSLPLLIEYVYVFAFIGMMSSGYRRRFGDRWGDTYVVNAETDLLTRG